MSTIQTGAWRTGADGTYKVFIRGCEQQADITVEVISRAGDSAYVVLTGTHSKISGGYLYNYYRTGKPKPVYTPTPAVTSSMVVQASADGEEISIDELDAVLGLD